MQPLGSGRNQEWLHRTGDTFASLEVEISNNGDANPYRKVGMDLIIEITCISSLLLPKTWWLVREKYTHSDHQAPADLKEAKNPEVTGPKWKHSLFNAFDIIINSTSTNWGSGEIALEWKKQRCSVQNTAKPEECSTSRGKSESQTATKLPHYLQRDLGKQKRKL